jgi:spermidine/putrescine ABC transporter ATP-binding subunit
MAMETTSRLRGDNAQAGAGDAADVFDVELRNITKRFGSVVAVDNVSLGVRRGEFMSLLGPSGCGKTTTLRMIAGFEQPDEGELLIGGTDAVGVPPYRRDVNMVFQQYALFPHMSVLDNVAYGLKQRGLSKAERRRRAGEALELVRLTGRDHHRPSMLSGGQQQRVALARSLVMNPRVLLLDEPLGALDLKLRKEMQLFIKALQNDLGITFIHVTHDQGEALSMSDRVAVMSNGVIEQLDEPRAIYDHPVSAFVADFIGDMNFVDAIVVDAANGAFSAEAGGGVVIRGTGRARRRTRVRIGLRPERLVVRPGSTASGPNSAIAEVLAKLYLGDQVQVVVKLPNDTTLTVREQRATADPGMDTVQPGDTVTVSWDEAAPLLMNDRVPTNDVPEEEER